MKHLQEKEKESNELQEALKTFQQKYDQEKEELTNLRSSVVRLFHLLDTSSEGLNIPALDRENVDIQFKEYIERQEQSRKKKSNNDNTCK